MDDRFSNRALGSSSFLIFGGLIVHAGHASLRSLLARLRLEPLHACMDQGLESLAVGRARSAAVNNGFIHPVVRMG